MRQSLHGGKRCLIRPSKTWMKWLSRSHRSGFPPTSSITKTYLLQRTMQSSGLKSRYGIGGKNEEEKKIPLSRRNSRKIKATCPKEGKALNTMENRSLAAYQFSLDSAIA